MRRSCARSAAPALNVPKPTEWPSKQATISPVRLRFERDVTGEPGGKRCRRGAVALLWFRERASRDALQVWG